MADLHSIKPYTATGTTQDFLVPFPFLQRSHVTVTQDGVEIAFTWINDGKITVTPTVSSGEIIKLTRSTSVTSRLVTFSSPSSLTPSNLNNSALQLFYMAQESLDGQEQDSDAATSAAAAATSATAAAASAAAVASDVNIWAGTASGVDTILLTPSDALSSYSTGMKVRFVSAGAGTGAATINISSLGAKTLKKQGGDALIANDIPATAIIEATYDGTDFFLDTGTATIKKATLINEISGSNIASAATTDISAATGNYIHITGSTGPITSFGTVSAGAERTLVFDSTPSITHNVTSLIMPNGLNRTMVADDKMIIRSEGGGNWRVIDIIPTTGVPITDPVALVWTNSGAINLSSGTPTAVSLASSLSNISTIEGIIISWSSNTANQSPMIQIGDSGGLESSGYSGEAVVISTTAATESHNTGFLITKETDVDAAMAVFFSFTLRHMGSNVWAFNSTGSVDSTVSLTISNGIKTLSAALDRISITTSGGSATFDDGTAYLRYR